MQDSRLVAFYRGDGRDDRGRLLSHIHQYSFDSLEHHHDYIQWLFPLPEPSGANPSAPLLTADDIAAFHADHSLRETLLESFQLMLQFYGLDVDTRGDSVVVAKGEQYEERSRIWLRRGNHNLLRISRILRSLTLLGLGRYAQALLECLEEIYKDAAPTIGTTTMGYWRRAIASN